MNESSKISEHVTGSAPQAFGDAPSPIKPNLSVALREGGAAVNDDLQQANNLTIELEAQLAGKSKELLHLKFLLEQTKSHFGHMQDSVAALRVERHKLANEAMRAQGLDFMLARVTAERDRLKVELDGVMESLATENAQKEQQSLRFDKRDKMIAELKFEVMTLRQQVAELRRANPPPSPVLQPRPLKTSADKERLSDSDEEGVEVFPAARITGQRGRI